ncbi:hypothetical protein EJB05_29670, partial [Eragrostis curvula]
MMTRMEVALVSMRAMRSAVHLFSLRYQTESARLPAPSSKSSAVAVEPYDMTEVGGGDRGAAVARRHHPLAPLSRPVRRSHRPPAATRATRHRQIRLISFYFALHCTSRFVKDDDRKRALVRRLLQYSLVHRVLGIPFHQITICRTAEGKPYLHNENATFRNFNFNTSHQGSYVGIASEPFCLVGLDIVSISKPQGETVTDFINKFSSYLTEHEWNCIVRAGSPNEVLTEFYMYNSSFIGFLVDDVFIQNQHFSYRYWCLKEAYVKAIGAGVGFGLHRLEFRHVDWTNISICIDDKESRKWKFWLFKLDEMHLVRMNSSHRVQHRSGDLNVTGYLPIINNKIFKRWIQTGPKGHPEDAINSYKKTLSNFIIEEEQLHAIHSGGPRFKSLGIPVRPSKENL